MADSHLLTDIRLVVQHSELRPVYAAATAERRVPGAGPRLDFATLSGRDNLGQAVFLRLLTPRGELAPLGHPAYGSRLHELIGRQNSETTRSLVKLHILESLQQEVRIARVLRLDVTPSAIRRDRVDVLLVVEPAGSASSVTIGPFTLELES